jgi:hypothetical protein
VGSGANLAPRMETLASRIAREGGFTEVDAVGWVIRLARSVEEMHGRGAVHGRLSADGIRIALDACDSEGQLIDFADLPENVAYHSPERERGEGGSQADDTWAVAVTLYFALSGSLPFHGATDVEVRRKIANVPAPPLAVYDVGDDDLQAIVDRALARSREARTSTVAELRRQLEGWGPAAGLGVLPPLRTGEVGDLEEEVTMIHQGGGEALRMLIEAATAGLAPAAPPPAAPPPTPAAPALALHGLVDDASISDEPSDPFAVPPSRADVSAPPASFKPPISSLPPPPFRRSADPPASVATPEAQPQAPPRRRWRLPVVLAVVILVGLAAGYYFTSESAPQGPLPADPSAPIATAPAPGTTAPPPPASAPSVAPSASGPVTMAAPPAPAAPIDVTACVKPLFPADSLDASSDFAFVCAEADPIKGGAAVRTQLVRAHKNMTDGMKEWALLGWYELAAFSVLRAQCCPGAPPQKLPELPRGCTPVPDALGEIAAAARATSEPADPALKKAVDAYTDDVHCVVRAGLATRFGRVGNPQGGEDTTFMRFLGRVVAAKR